MSTLLNSGVLRNLRRVVADLATDTCVIQTPAGVTTSAGGVTNPTTSTATVACHIAPAQGGAGRGEEGIFADRLAGRTLWQITFPVGAVIGTTALVFSPNTNPGSRRFEVLGLKNPRTHEAAVQVYAAEKT